jgi:hypothetical protein
MSPIRIHPLTMIDVSLHSCSICIPSRPRSPLYTSDHQPLDTIQSPGEALKCADLRQFLSLFFTFYFVEDKKMLLTTRVLLCLAFGTSHILTAVRSAPNPTQPHTMDPDKGRASPEETAIPVEETAIVVETVVVSAPPKSSSISSALPSATLVPASPPKSSPPASSSLVSPLPEPSTKKPDTTFCGTSSK